jgi:hypothetical protein
VGVVAFVVVPSCANSHPNDVVLPGPAPTPSSAAGSSIPPIGPSSSPDHPLRFGTSVTPAKGWSVEVNAAELRADDTMSNANDDNFRPEAGKHYVLANLTVTNGTDQPGIWSTQLQFSLHTTAGADISEDSCRSSTPPSSLLSAGAMRPGATATGNVCFEASDAELEDAVLLVAPADPASAEGGRQYLSLR